MSGLLPTEFLAQYEGREPNWGPLGPVTYQRTYARPLGDGRSERWYETVRRVVEGDMLRMELAGDSRPFEQRQREAMLLYDLIFNLVILPSGRNLWMSGTEYERQRGGDALNNCWWVPFRPYNGKVSYPLAFMFDRLMLGGGVGFGIRNRDIQEMPPVKNQVALYIACDEGHPDFRPGLMVPSHLVPNPDGDYFWIEDSREGWAEAISLVIDFHFSGRARSLILDISDVRPFGAPIRGFGGTSSGPLPLVELLVAINGIMNMAVGRRMESHEWLDIGNLIGRCVVSGNVRRSAEIAVGDFNDMAFMTAKRSMGEVMSRRWASNNSLAIYRPEDLSLIPWRQVADGALTNGEPGFVNLYLAQNYGRLADGYQEGIDAEADGPNPCGEIILAPFEPCNLVDYNPLFAERMGVSHRLAWSLASRYAYRVTFARYSWEPTQKVIVKNRRTGVSLTGFVDWCLYRFGRIPTGPDDTEIAREVGQWYQYVREANREYAEQLGQNPSIKVTAVKPSGTVSLLPGVSAGVHFPYDAFYIRRIRFQVNDPLVSRLEQAGYRVEADKYSPNTAVIEFPVAARAQGGLTSKTASIRDQFACVEFLAHHWADNAVSCTVTVKPHEMAEAPALIEHYASRLKSLTVLPEEEHGYVQAPYESISKEAYEAYRDSLRVKPENLGQLLTGDDGQDILALDDCATGACPVR